MNLPEPYYEEELVTLYHGDAMELAPLLGRFDAIVTDPPYGETSLEWDVWPEGWVKRAAALANSLWCFGSFRMFWERRAEFVDWKLAQDVVWEKANGSSMLTDRFRRVHEFAVQFYRGEWGAVYKLPPMVEIHEDRDRGRIVRSTKPQHFTEIGEKHEYEYTGRRLRRSVMKVASCHKKAVNETQKPEELVKPLVEYCVPPGGRVIDLFAGSGTTLYVARELGMKAVGIEKRESQCREIVDRLSQQTFVL